MKEVGRSQAVNGAAGVLLLGVGMAACAAMTWLAWLPVGFSQQALPFLAIYAVLFAVYVFGLRWLSSVEWPAIRKVGMIIAVGIGVRLILLPAPPLLDDDIYRYRWDGRVLASGMNPYAFAPESPELAHLSGNDPLFAKIGFRDVPAVYPPASMVLFAAGHSLSPESIWGVKALVVLSEAVIFAAILGLLSTFRKPLEWVAVYAWNPLVLKEFANSGHHDAAGIAVFMAVLWALASNRRTLAALGLATAALVKPIVFATIPALWGRLRVRDWILVGAATGLVYVPFAGIGFARLFAGMETYARHWEMNDSVFALLQAAFGGPAPSRSPGFLFETNPLARLAALVLLAVVVGWALYDVQRERKGMPLERGPVEGGLLRAMWRVAVILAAVLALTPTMDPWYLCWLVPFLCFFRWEAGILMTGTVGLSYLYYWQGRDHWWLRPLEYLPVLGWAAWEGLRARSRAPQSA